MRWAWLVGMLALGCGGETDETELVPLEQAAGVEPDAGVEAAVAPDTGSVPAEPEFPHADRYPSCIEGDVRCNLAVLERCRDDRTAFVVVEVCASAEACDSAEGVCR
jgi:hypothetical protein